MLNKRTSIKFLKLIQVWFSRFAKSALKSFPQNGTFQFILEFTQELETLFVKFVTSLFKHPQILTDTESHVLLLVIINLCINKLTDCGIVLKLCFDYSNIILGLHGLWEVVQL